jgi:3-oxoacyl-[acyl-carrier protein] reductase
MELELRGKVALVTGSSRGIGRSIAEALAAEGCQLMLTGRDETALAAAAAAITALGATAKLQIADLRREEAPASLAAATERAFGRLDILVNNAGATKRGDFLALTDADWQDGYALKFFAHVRLARAAWPLLQRSRGSLVTIAGIGGRAPTADFTIGGSVNAAAMAFTKALADLGKSAGVQVNAINPGHVDTDRLQHRLHALMREAGLDEAGARERCREMLGITRLGLPQDIAGLVAFIVSPRGRWLHGATIDMDGGQLSML